MAEADRPMSQGGGRYPLLRRGSQNAGGAGPEDKRGGSGKIGPAGQSNVESHPGYNRSRGHMGGQCGTPGGPAIADLCSVR